MKKLWEVVANILMIPWLIIEWLWSLIPLPSKDGKFVKFIEEEGMTLIFFSTIFISGLLGVLFTEGWWILAIFIIVVVPMMMMDLNGVEDKLGLALFASTLLSAILAGVVYGVIGIFGIEMTTERVTEWKAKNITYIADPNDKYILMNKETMTTHNVPMKEFYVLRETGCKEVHKTKTVKTPKTFHKKFGENSDIKYECKNI